MAVCVDVRWKSCRQPTCPSGEFTSNGELWGYQSVGGAGSSGRVALVAMVEAAHFWERDDATGVRALHKRCA
jgi:hypothetical protein